MTPHPRSYRPDLPSTAQSYTAIMNWARSLEKDQAAEIETSPRKLHPRSYRPDLSHWGYSFAQLTSLTQAERKVLRTRPLVIVPDVFMVCPTCKGTKHLSDPSRYGTSRCTECNEYGTVRKAPINASNIAHYATIAREAIRAHEEQAA